MQALLAQLKAEMKRTVRNKRYMFFTLVMPIAFYLIFVSQVGAKTKIGGADWSAYYLMSMSVFGVIGGSLNTLGITLATERKDGWVRLLRTTPMPNWVYLFSKMASQLVMNLGIIVVMFLVGRYAEHVDLSVGQWLGAAVWIWLGSLAFMSIGLFVGMFGNPQVAQILATGVQLVFSMLGGLWTPIQFLPTWMQDFAKFLPTYRLGHVSWDIVAGNGIEVSDITTMIAYLLVFMVLSVWMNKRQEAVTA